MVWLIIGLLLWVAAHLFKRVMPEQRAAMGDAGRGAVAVVALVAVVLMVIGYRSAPETLLYASPPWAWMLNNLLMLIAVFLLGAGKAGGVVAAKVRHPMLTAVVIWAVAHLIVKGYLATYVMFGGLGLWAVAEMVVINRAEGPWARPAEGPVANDFMVAGAALIVFALIVAVHYWLGHPSMPYMFPRGW